MTDRVLILDFGSQFTQLIARRVRENGVYCEIMPFNTDVKKQQAFEPKAIILSGGPASLTEQATPRAPNWVFEAGKPLLGICYGEQAIAAQLGGEVEAGHNREFGRAEIEVKESSPFFDGVWEKGKRYPIWMNHGDKVTAIPPGFKAIAVSDGSPSPPSRMRAAGSTACSSIPRWCTRRTAPSFSAISPAASPDVRATGR